MKKKIILAAAGLFSVFTLAACSSGSKDIATMKGATITVEDFYNQIKTSSDSQDAFSSMIIYKVFEDKYGDKVTDKDIQKKYDEFTKQVEAQGSTVSAYLKQSNQTEAGLKKIIKQNLAYQEGLKAHVKITDDDLKAAWESFHPEVEAQIIQVATEDEANAVKKQITDGEDFAKVAKDKSVNAATKEDGGKIKFDSKDTTVPDTVKEAAFKLKDGEVSEPVAATDSSYQTTYYIVKMTKNKAKGNDMKPYKKELKEIAEATKLSDNTFIAKVISDELKEANVKIKDKAFDNALSGYMQTETSSSAKKDTKSSKTKSSESKKTKSSDSEKSKSSESKTSDSEKTAESSNETTTSSSK
jgi:foldase protein PrsA